MSPDLILYAAVILSLACVLQSAVGFGSGLFAIPLLVWLGVELPTTVAISVSATFCQAAWGCYGYRAHFRWREVMPLTALRLATMPVGLWLMSLLVDVGQSRIKQAVGAILLGVLVLQWALRVEPRDRLHGGWTVAAGTSSGLLTGLVGMGGPPLVLWVMAHDWSSQRARVFLWANMILLTGPTLLLMRLKFGEQITTAVLIGLAFTPLVLGSSMLGMRLGAMLSRARLRTAALTVLALIALSSLLGPLLSVGR